MPIVFGIFQIGPVQEFITCAKKTQDFWSGSYLLSYLNCVAIDTVIQNCEEDKNVIIYPSLDNQPLFEYVQSLRINRQKPWDNNPRSEKNELRSTTPNRFVCKLDESRALTILKQAEDAVKQNFSEFVTHVQSELEDKISKRFSKINPIQSQNTWNDIWTRQGKKFFEIYWTISTLEPNNYLDSYQQAEALFGARKAVRDFSQINEPGYKCTLCGLYEPLNSQDDGSLKREKLKDFWDKVRQTTGYRFREEEHLCAICTTKRLAPNYIFGRASDFPSTSSFSVADFVGDIIKKHKEKPTAFLDKDKEENLIVEFVKKVKVVAQQERIDFKVESLPKLDSAVSIIPPLLELVKMDGDWLLEETYDNIVKHRESLKADLNLKDVKDSKTSLKALVNRVKYLAREEGIVCPGPGKYYSVFQMDGDNMGEKISEKKLEEEHRQFSKDLCDFSVNLIPTIVETQHLGKVIYFGGDEGIAFVSFKDILPTIEECRESFEKNISGTTTSIGLVIAHHQQALLQVLSEVRKTVKMVKDDLVGKNGFCIALMKRSGGTNYGMAHWQYNELKVVPLLQDLVKYYQEGKISDRWYYQFATEKLGLLEVIEIGTIRVNRDAAQLEISRLVSRHADKKKINPSELNRLLERLKTLLFEVNDWEQFMGLMGVAVYIARGGGR